MTVEKIESIHQIEYLSRELKGKKRIVFLLHGFAQNMDFMWKKFEKHISDDCCVISFNGLFPIVMNFPLSKERKDGKPLLHQFAWYFYDAATDSFPIDYQIPAELIHRFLENFNTENLPVTLLGYSQGGYLTPFIAEKYELVDHIIGINCSWRYDMLNKGIKQCRVDSFNADCDVVVDPFLAQSKLEELDAYAKETQFHLLKDETHKLTESMVKNAVGLIST